MRNRPLKCIKPESNLTNRGRVEGKDHGITADEYNNMEGGDGWTEITQVTQGYDSDSETALPARHESKTDGGGLNLVKWKGDPVTSSLTAVVHSSLRGRIIICCARRCHSTLWPRRRHRRVHLVGVVIIHSSAGLMRHCPRLGRLFACCVRCRHHIRGLLSGWECW